MKDDKETSQVDQLRRRSKPLKTKTDREPLQNEKTTPPQDDSYLCKECRKKHEAYNCPAHGK
ncbi:unnamed protein product, partial [Nesidiocoris tenuis]